MTNTGQLNLLRGWKQAIIEHATSTKLNATVVLAVYIQVVVTYLACPIHLCATFDQQLDNFHVPVNGCPYKRRHAKL
jgi:hypothetical protein